MTILIRLAFRAVASMLLLGYIVYHLATL